MGYWKGITVLLSNEGNNKQTFYMIFLWFMNIEFKFTPIWCVSTIFPFLFFSVFLSLLYISIFLSHYFSKSQLFYFSFYFSCHQYYFFSLISFIRIRSRFRISVLIIFIGTFIYSFFYFSFLLLHFAPLLWLNLS